MTVTIKPAPKHARGEGVADALHRAAKWAKAASVEYDDTSPINLFEIPGDVRVVGGYVEVTTAFEVAGSSAAATVAITVPNATGTKTLWDAAGVGLLSTGAKQFSAWDVTPSSGGYVIATYTAGTTTAGAFQVYLSYIERDSEL